MATRVQTLVGVAGAAIVIGFFSMTASSLAATYDCGTVAGAVPAYNVTATNYSCFNARRLVRAWFSSVFSGRCSRFACRVFAMRCNARPPARISYTVSCSGGVRRVAFRVVAD